MIVSMSASSAFSIPPEDVQWAQTCLPNLWASSVIAENSSTLNDGLDGWLVRVLPPVAVTLMKSAPSLMSCLTAARHSVAPVAVVPK